jgi:hypothetical protein
MDVLTTRPRSKGILFVYYRYYDVVMTVRCAEISNEGFFDQGNRGHRLHDFDEPSCGIIS